MTKSFSMPSVGGLVLGLSISLAPSVLSAQESDVTPPLVVSFDFTPKTIDTRSSPQTVTATGTLSDDLSGVSFCQVDFTSPSFRQRQFLFFRNPPTSGTDRNGIYSGSVEFPRFVESGMWTVSVNCFDNLFNQNSVTTSQLQALGFPTTLTVVSTEDTSPPEITTFHIDPATANVSSSAQTVTVSIGLSDGLSGVHPGLFSGSGAALVMRSPSGKQTHAVGNDRFSLVSGTLNDGTWQATFVLPRYSEAGDWTVDRLFFADLVGNFIFVSGADLVSLGLPGVLHVTAVPSDTTPPHVLNLRISPAFIDTSAGSQTVLVTIDAGDDLAGVSFTPSFPFTTCFSDPTNFFKRIGVLLASPSGAQNRCLQPNFGFGSGAISLTGGTPQLGTWQGTIFFPQFSEAGTWNASLILKDAVENFVSYQTSDLEALGLQTTLTVIRPSLAGDGTIGSDGGTVSDTVFGSRAQVSAPPGVLGESTTVAIDVLSTPIGVPNPSGYAAPGTPFVNIQLTPTPSFPLAPPGLTIVLPLLDPMAPGTRLDLFRIDPATGILVPSLDTTGNPISGVVDLTGLSVTFTGVSHLSTVVGLIPSDTTPPVMVLPGDLVVEATSANGAVVTFDTSASDEKDGPVGVSCSHTSGSLFPLGVTRVDCSASDSHGNTVEQSFTVTVVDTTPPAIARVASNRTELWPPNNKFVPVAIAVTAYDAVTSQPSCNISSVSSNESGAQSWRVTGALTVELLAARKGTGTGRVYLVGVTCIDEAGNVSAEGQTTVTVRHDQSRKKD